MAQGQIKSRVKPTASSNKKSAPGLKKGLRSIAPKRSVLVKNAKIVKKHSAGLTAMTERTLASKAGHLELLKGGKKTKDARGRDIKTETEVKKGGTRKFG